MNNNKSFFWTSYADLMTSLFFIMLVLFIISVVLLSRKVGEIEYAATATKVQLEKIKEIEAAVNEIDPRFFKYDAEHKKHILNIDVSFNIGSADITNIPIEKRTDLLEAGKSIREFIVRAHQEYKVNYLLIVEGQASKDDYPLNYELSYERALSLVKYWSYNGIYFDNIGCETLISGSGQSGVLRSFPDDRSNRANQRFLIHIIPKPGIMEGE